MGVHIYGIEILKRKVSKDMLKDKNSDFGKTYTLAGFERSLLKKEQRYRDYFNDKTLHDGVSCSYSYYNQIREELAFAFLGKKIDKIWQKCSNLSQNQRYYCSLYHILNFADNEGYVGPQAVKKMAKYLTPQRINKFQIYCKNSKKNDLLYYGMDLIDCILTTAKNHNGYIVFS